MKTFLRWLLPVLGVLVILSAFRPDARVGRSGLDFFLTLAFGGALVASPFFALGAMFMYLMMMICIVGGPLLGGYIGATIGGKDSLAIGVGFLVGGFLGFKFALSETFEKLMRPAQSLARMDEEERKK